MIAPRSPLQLIVALFVCLCYTILVTHQLPFVTNSSDRLSVVCVVSLTLTLSIGLLQMAEFSSLGDDKKLFAASEVLDFVLMGVSTLPIIVFAYNFVLHACGGKFRRSRRTVLVDVLPEDQSKSAVRDKWNLGSSEQKE